MADVGVGVDETGRDIQAAGVQYLSRIPTCVRGARSDVANSPIQNCNLHPIEDFTRIDVDQLSSDDDQVGLELTHRPSDEPLYLRSGTRHDNSLTHRKLLYQRSMLGACQ